MEGILFLVTKEGHNLLTERKKHQRSRNSKRQRVAIRAETLNVSYKGTAESETGANVRGWSLGFRIMGGIGQDPEV